MLGSSFNVYKGSFAVINGPEWIGHEVSCERSTRAALSMSAFKGKADTSPTLRLMPINEYTP
jgi:hypothetical protein